MNNVTLSGEIKKIIHKTNKFGDRYGLVYLSPNCNCKSEKPITLVVRGKNVGVVKNGLQEGDTALFIGELVHVKKGYFVEVIEIELYSFVRFEEEEEKEYNLEIK